MAFPICINKHLSVEEAEESRDGKPIGVLGSYPPHVYIGSSKSSLLSLPVKAINTLSLNS